MSASEEAERWKWCNDKNPVPSCGDDGIEACIKGWYWGEVVKPQRSRQPEPSNSSTKAASQPQKQTSLSKQELLERVLILTDFVGREIPRIDGWQIGRRNRGLRRLPCAQKQ